MSRGRRRRVGTTILLAGATAALAIAAWISRPLPSRLLRSGLEPGTVLRDREGRVLRDARAIDGSRRRWVPLDRVDPDLLAAFLAAEDRRFYRHHGVDLLAAARAARANLRAGRIVSGGSTITMQLARILRPSPRPSTACSARAAESGSAKSPSTPTHHRDPCVTRHLLARASDGTWSSGIPRSGG